MTGQLKAPVREVAVAVFEGNLAAGGSGKNRRIEGRSKRTQVIERIIKGMLMASNPMVRIQEKRKYGAILREADGSISETHEDQGLKVAKRSTGRGISGDVTNSPWVRSDLR